MGTAIGQRAQELARLNPWWRSGKAWALNDVDLAEVRQLDIGYRSGVLDALEPGNLYMLRGPRRVGKTVAVKQCIEQLLSSGVPETNIVRIAADDWVANDLRTLLQNTALPPHVSSAPRYWFIDEITSVTGGWAQQIKWLRDNDSEFRQSTVVLTGSSATGLTEAAGTLAGRRGTGTHLDRILLPMGFRTFSTLLAGDTLPSDIPVIELQDLHSNRAAAIFHQLLPWLDDLVKLWELYVNCGGFPRMVAAVKAGRVVDEAFLEDLFNVVSGDAFKNSRLSVPQEMELFERLWKGMTGPFNLSSVAQDLGLGVDTVARHVKYLRDAFLLWQCPVRADDKWVARPGAQDKVYAIDPVIARLPHLRNPARSDIDLTALVEMQLGMALRRNILSHNKQASTDEFLFYYRTPTRKEIDFVSEYLSGIAIEGKYIQRGNWASESATVNASPYCGILATRNVLDTSDVDSAWAIPAGILAYLIDT